MELIENMREQLETRLRQLQPALDEATQIKKLLDAGQCIGGQTPRQMLRARTDFLPRLGELHLLALLRHKPARVKDLAEALQVTPGRVVQLVNALEAEGTAKRIDGGVEITSAGLRFGRPR